MGPRHLIRSDAGRFASIVAAALAVRVVVVLATPDPQLGSNARIFDHMGRSLAHGGGFGDTLLAAGGGPTAFQPPAYAGFLAAVYRGVESIGAARMAGAVLGALAVALLAFVAHRLAGRQVALVAGLLAAVYPPLVLSGTALAPDSLFVPLELLALAAVVERRHRLRAERHTRLVRLLPWLAGIAAGLATLTRPFSGAALIVPLALLTWPGSRTRRGRIIRNGEAMAGIVAVFVGAILTVAPWTVRNLVTMDEVIPVSNIDSFILAGVYNDQAANTGAPFTAAFRPPDGVPALAGYFNDARIDEATLSLRLRDAAFDYLGDHPLYLPEVVAWNTARLFDLTGFEVAEAVYRDEFAYSEGWARLAVVSWWLLAAVALPLVVVRPPRRVTRLVWLAPALVWAFTVPLTGNSQLRTPIDPFVVLAAAMVIGSLIARRREEISESVAA